MTAITARSVLWPSISVGNSVNEGHTLLRLGSLMLWSALTVCGLLDFASTLSLCIIVIGMERACRCALAEADYLSALLT